MIQFKQSTVPNLLNWLQATPPHSADTLILVYFCKLMMLNH